MRSLCRDCGKNGQMGNDVRTYIVTSPLAEFSVVWCFKCFERQKKRPKVTIRSK